MHRSIIRVASIFIVSILIAPINAQGRLPQKRHLKLTYIANAGFLIEYNSKKVLIDALHLWPNFQSTPDEIFNDMVSSKSPFNDIDLILVTHEHPDHYHPDMVESVLSRNPKSVFIGPPNAVKLLKIVSSDIVSQISETQIRYIDLQVGGAIELSENGIGLKIFGLDHGGPSIMINYAYLIKIDDKTLFHKGDSEVNDEFFLSNNFRAEKIDILFAQEYSEKLNKIIGHTHPKHIVYQHIRPRDFVQLSKTIREKYPDVILFEKPMESKVFH